MSFPTRSLPPTHLRGQSTSHAGSSVNQSPVLVARIAEKKAELESLKQLRDLSAAVATQMEALEQKLSTLSDGTEGTAGPLLEMTWKHALCPRVCARASRAN